MAASVESRTCKKCGSLYRTKMKKGGKLDSRTCPSCGTDNTPTQTDPVERTVVMLKSFQGVTTNSHLGKVG